MSLNCLSRKSAKCLICPYWTTGNTLGPVITFCFAFAILSPRPKPLYGGSPVFCEPPELKGVLNKQKLSWFLFFDLYHFLCQLCDGDFTLPRIASLDKFVAFYTVRILTPDVFVFLPPAAYQIRTDKNISFAPVTGDEMTSANVEHPYYMAEPAFDITEKVAKYKVVCFRHSNHSLSRSMIRPFLI